MVGLDVTGGIDCVGAAIAGVCTPLADGSPEAVAVTVIVVVAAACETDCVILSEREIAPPMDGLAYSNVIYFLILERKYDEAIARITHDLELPAGRNLPPLLQAIAQMTIGTMHLAAGRESEGRAILLRSEADLKTLREQGNNSSALRATIQNVSIT